MTDADKVMNLASDPANNRNRIRINPEICIRPDNFWLRIDALAEVCALWAQSSCVYGRHSVIFEEL